mmetsp:Transcript_31370/g.65479  ORF Transcript_31370/g.65479 Transcript_31370/m.65479 type:complete len:96 (+) Transcript_31370:1289-1576(+)
MKPAKRIWFGSSPRRIQVQKSWKNYLSVCMYVLYARFFFVSLRMVPVKSLSNKNHHVFVVISCHGLDATMHGTGGGSCCLDDDDLLLLLFHRLGE